MSIRQSILLLVLLSLVSICSIGGYAVVQSSSSANQVKTITDRVVPSALASADLVSLLKDVQLATIYFVDAPKNSDSDSAQKTLSERKTQLQQGLELQLQQANSTTQKAVVSEAKDELDGYFSAIDASIKLKLEGKDDLAQSNLAANVFVYERELRQVLDTLRTEKNRTKDDAITVLKKNLSDTVRILSAVTLLALILLAGLGILLYRRITLPISRMQVMMTDIATSQDFSRRLPLDREDEIGRSIAAFNTMIAKIQESSSLLKQKSADIQSMLQNIPQGILTIVQGNTIHPEYSAYLESILEVNQIDHCNVMEVVFSGSTLGANVLSQVEATIAACIGEDLMNFEFNEHLLITEFEKVMADGTRKIIELNWSPIANEAGCTDRLLLSLRDVTELRMLAAEANQKKHELEIIGEIISLSQEKFYEFIENSMNFINENHQLIAQHSTLDSDVVAQLFRNMHTLKGNARTYGLAHLANKVHATEQTYAALRKQDSSMTWDQQRLLVELAEVQAFLEQYARINEESLGRRGPGRRGNVERYLLVDKQQIQDTIRRLEAVNVSNLHELLEVREAVHQVLRSLGTESLHAVLKDIIDSLPSLAQELEKPAPQIHIHANGFVVKNQAASVLKNVFMHLIRNSLDHGIEPTPLRIAEGKPETGTLTITLQPNGPMMDISLTDDGRGLALDNIRTSALEKGLLSDQDTPKDSDIAKVIFKPGFSTAKSVTNVSGRGVGMDAVLNFVKREGGTVDLRFTDNRIGSKYRSFELVVALPVSHFVNMNEKDFLSHYVHFGQQSNAPSGTNPQALQPFWIDEENILA